MNGRTKFFAAILGLFLSFALGYYTNVVAQSVDIAVIQQRLAQTEKRQETFALKENIEPRLASIKRDLDDVKEKLDVLILNNRRK